MPDELDYKAIAEKLQPDLELARLEIVKMRFARSPLDRLDGDSIRKFVEKNYVVIVVVLMLLSFILSSLKTIKGLLNKPPSKE